MSTTDTQVPQALRCAGCRKTMGWTTSVNALRHAVYCSEWCVHEAPVTPMEARNDGWHILLQAGRSRASIARDYEVAHSLVYKTLAR